MHQLVRELAHIDATFTCTEKMDALALCVGRPAAIVDLEDAG